MDILEGTAEFNRHFAYVTGEIPITVHDGGDGMTPMMVTPPHRDPVHDDAPAPKPVAKVGAAEHPITTLADFESAMEVIDESPIVAACDLENPESCESCT